MAIGADWGRVGPGWDRGPANWSTYFGVADCDAAVAAAQGAGGRLLAPAMEIAGVGRFAFLQDPQGAVFAVIAFVGCPANPAKALQVKRLCPGCGRQPEPRYRLQSGARRGRGTSLDHCAHRRCRSIPSPRSAR